MRGPSRKLGIAVVAVIAGGLIGTIAGAGSAPAGAETTTGSQATYVGMKKCRKCHLDDYKTWKKTAHSETWDLLAEEYRNDESKDESGELCVSCHITGYGKPGGPATMAEGLEAGLEGTQCEACHGPGSAHVDLANKHKEAEEMPQEVLDAIDKTPQNTCIDCHNPHISHEQYKQE